MTEVARNLSDINDTPDRNFCTEFCFVIHTMEFQLCSEYLIQLHSYACDHEPHTHTYSTFSYNCNDTISANVCGICRHATESNPVSIVIAQAIASSQQRIPF